jgi:hypothetical protein
MRSFKIQKRLFHLALPRRHTRTRSLRSRRAILSIPMHPHIKHSKTADKSNRLELDREVSEKIDNVFCAAREGKVEDERREKDAEHFLHEE